MRLERLKLQEVLKLYNRVMLASGGEPGVLKLDSLKSILERPFSGVSNKEFYKSLNEKAAVIMYSIVKYHPFVNGNKRMAYEITDIFLRRNGYYISTKVNEIFRVFNQIAEGKFTQEQTCLLYTSPSPRD